MKKGKVAIGIVTLFMVIAVIAILIVNLFIKQDITTAGLIDETANASVRLGDTTIELNKLIKHNKKSNAKTDFAIDGKQIVQEAAKLLGKNYNMGSGAQYGGKGGVYSNTAYEPDQIREMDCSGLVAWSLKRLGYEINGPLGNSALPTNPKVPIDGNHLVTYAKRKCAILFE
ncbi:MAG: hypothetical protein IJX34_00480 [Clostridia bacterium]|nr:hypothetical protein [Clostridia bacterium]